MRELGVPRLRWRYVRVPADLNGVSVENVIVVVPPLEVGQRLDRVGRLQIDAEVARIERRDGGSAIRVRT